MSQQAVSRILSPASAPTLRLARRRGDDHSSSPAIAGGIKRPTRRLRTGRPATAGAFPRVAIGASLFGLAPCGVLPATRVTTGAVRSYRTFSPLPERWGQTPPSRRYVFCATVLQVALTGDYPAHCPAEFGLSSPPSRLAAIRRGGYLARCEGLIVLRPTRPTDLPDPPDLIIRRSPG